MREKGEKSVSAGRLHAYFSPSIPGLAMPAALHAWELPLSLASGLLVAALVGWLAGGYVANAVALVAMAEIGLLWMRLRRLTPTKAGLPSKFQGGATDFQRDRFVTRARRLAANLHALRRAAGSLPDAIVLLDHDQRVRWFNHAAERLLGLRRPEDRGMLLKERLHHCELAHWLEESSPEPLNDISAPGAPDRHIHVALLPFGARQRVLLARDVSHMARLEQIRRDFVANVSHELRTPLTVIHGYLELLDPEDMSHLAPVLNEMRAQSKRMGQIVEDLLTLSRLENQDHVHEERVSMAPLLATLRKEAQALSQGRHSIRVENLANVDLLGSAKDLHSALSNLVSNAVRYTPSGGCITICWERNAEGANYSVTDTGYGIPANHLARLTERFYRVSSSRSRDSGGTGLGLSIVKHVLGLHQARLDITSTLGRGSTFTCCFGSERLMAPETPQPAPQKTS